MFKGFYNLTSAMLTHQDHLNVIGNNMVNVSTAGYKQEQYTATTFDDVLYNRVGNKDGRGTEIGRQSYIRAGSDIATDYTQGTLEPTGQAMDFAIVGDGFFAIEKNGVRSYTRMGNFSLDEEGYLCLQDFGRVLDVNEEEIFLGTDRIVGDSQGIISYEDGGAVARLGVFSADDLEALVHTPEGFFQGGNMTLNETAQVENGILERANTDLVKQMTDMISVQRSLQSAAQISRIYDQLMTKATNELGRL